MTEYDDRDEGEDAVDGLMSIVWTALVVVLFGVVASIGLVMALA